MRRYLSVVRLLVIGIVLFAALSAPAAQGWLDVITKESEAEGAKDGPTVRLYSASKALVIGMDHYGGTGWFAPRGSGWPVLSMGIKDAEAVRDALAAQGFEVTFKKDLTSDELDRAFREFFVNAGADPEARLFVWFAGHGHTLNGEGYLVPIDAPPPSSQREFLLKALSLRRFGEYMRLASAKHVLAVFDSCFAGTIFNVARSAPPRAVTLATAQPVREFVSSGDADQTVSDNGAFRRLFVDALEGRERDADPNHDGYITGTELGLFMADKVTNYSEKGQTPRYGKLNAQGYDRGDFVFEMRKLETSPLVDAPSSAVPVPVPAMSAAEREWVALDKTSEIELRLFIERNGSSPQAASARAQLAMLKGEEVPNVREPASIAAPCDGVEARIGKVKKCVKPGTSFRDCPGCPMMVVIPGGELKLLNINTIARVRFDYPSAAGRTEVTYSEWAQCVEERSCRPPSGLVEQPTKPIVNIDWSDAHDYIKWLSKKTSQPYRLPSELEWQYAASAGSGWPDQSSKERICDYANVADRMLSGNKEFSDIPKANCFDTSGIGTVPVGSFKPNPWGIFDIIGNAGEWVEDCKADIPVLVDLKGKAATRGDPCDCSFRTIKGGS